MFKSPYLQILLFVITLITTTLAGAEWMFGKSFVFHHQTMGLAQFVQGFWFSLPFLTFLTFHEFGHYFVAKFKKIAVTLPYYIPAWFVIFTTIGTFGAFIRIKDPIKSKKDYFDIGIAGPLAGLVIAVITLSLGFYNLPGDEYVFKIHPEYQNFEVNYRKVLDQSVKTDEVIVLGKSLMYQLLESTFANPEKLPHPYEITHFPLILAGFLGLLFTALNLLPMGQLDGGHILYALIGRKAFNIVSPSILVLFVGYAGLGIFKPADFQLATNSDFNENLVDFILYCFFIFLCFSKIFKERSKNIILTLIVIFVQLTLAKIWPEQSGYSGFLAFGFLIGRVLGVYHPETFDTAPIGLSRKILGWITLLLFILCFTPNSLI